MTRDLSFRLMRGATLALMLGLPAAAQQQPLSASDWLSGSLKAPPRERDRKSVV